MNQQDPKRRIIKVIENLALDIESAGLADKVIIKSTNDPISDLENLCKDLISFTNTNQQKSVTNRLDNSDDRKINESIVLECLKQFINVYMELSKFSKLLFDGDYSRQLRKAYRKLYEAISTSSNCLYQFESQDQDFLREKQDLISENLQICEQIQNSSTPNSQYVINCLCKSKSKENTESESQEQTILSLRKQVEALNDMLRQNDDEFTLQIQRYNNTLFDMQETIREYEMRMDKMREYEATIDDLEHKLIRLKQEKYRDDMLIDNMSKKIRIYEKQRGGVDAFLSPMGRYTRKQGIPSSRLLASHNQSGVSNNVPMEPRFRNYYGDRVTSG